MVKKSNRFNEKDIVAAILVVSEIMDLEEFELQTRMTGKQGFGINDMKGGKWSEVNKDDLLTLGDVLKKLESPHNDYFLASYVERKNKGVEIPREDFDRKVLAFLGSEFCKDLLSCIDTATYLKYENKYFSGESSKSSYIDFLRLLNPGERERYVQGDVNFDAVGYLCDKSIALKIMDTQSGYPVVEHNNSVYVAAHCDWYDNTREMLDDLMAGETSFCNNYSSYGTLIETELYQVKDDMNDLGLINEFDIWEFYLSEYELEYVGLGEEKDKIKAEQKNVEFDEVLTDACVRSEALNAGKENSFDYIKE